MNYIHRIHNCPLTAEDFDILVLAPRGSEDDNWARACFYKECDDRDYAYMVLTMELKQHAEYMNK